MGARVRAAPSAVVLVALLASGCGNGASSMPVAPTPSRPTAALRAVFSDNPVPFRSSGCNVSTPQGWYTQVRVEETAGVALTVSTFAQKLDGNTTSLLSESFDSRFGACSGGASTPGSILANGAVCATVGICTTGTYHTYQFTIAGTDANGHAVTFDSPVLPLASP